MARSRLLGFFLVGGLGFLALGTALWGAGAHIVATTFLVIGVCWAGVAVLVGGYYTRHAKRQVDERHLFETGRRCRAVVEKVEQTASYVNHMPVFTLTVRVEPDGGEPFLHTRRLVTPPGAVPVPGQVVNAAVDPADRRRVALETRPGLAAVPAVVLATSGTSHDRLDQLERLARLREHGALTEAEFEAEKAKLLGADSDR